MFQTKLIRCSVLASVACLAAALSARSAQAVLIQVPLSPSNVIGGSGALSGTFNTGQFNATNIFSTQTGPVIETAQQGYWLNPDDGNATSPYITINLGSPKLISELELFNTGNTNNATQYGDRGTGKFAIYGSNSVTDTGGGNFALTSPTLLVTGTLAAISPAVASTSGIAGQFFGVSSSTAYQYLEFAPLSVASVNAACCGPTPTLTAFGLNELRVFTPEPGSFVLLGLGALGVGLVARRRRRA